MPKASMADVSPVSPSSSLSLSLDQTPAPAATTTQAPQQPPGLLYFPPTQTQTPTASTQPPRPQPRIGGMNDDGLDDPTTTSTISLDGPYDLHEDMRQALAASAGPKEKIALYGFPCYLATNIRRVLSRSRNGRGDWSIALSCLVYHGLQRYSALPAVRNLSQALQALDTDDGLGALAGEQVELWRRGFRFSIVDPTHTMGLEKCRSWKAPEHVHTDLFDLGGRLGVSGSTLGIVCVMVGLVDQEGVLDEHVGYMRGVIEELDQLLVERGRRLGRLVRAIEGGVWAP